MWALVGVPIDYATHVIVERVQVQGVWGPELGRGVALPVGAHPLPRHHGLVGGCRVLLELIGPYLGHSVEPGLHDVTENLHILFGNHPKSFLKLAHNLFGPSSMMFLTLAMKSSSLTASDRRKCFFRSATDGTSPPDSS